MKIIGFNGSPRKGGSTEWAVNTIIDGIRANASDAETKMFSEFSHNISPCRGCLACMKTGKCAVNDDMQEIYSELQDADALILASPVYMGQMTAQAKAFMDRLFAANKPSFSPGYTPRDKKIKLILVFTQGNPNKDLFKDYFDYTKRMFKVLEYDVRDVVVVAGTRGGAAREIEGMEEYLTNAGAGIL